MKHVLWRWVLSILLGLGLAGLGAQAAELAAPIFNFHVVQTDASGQATVYRSGQPKTDADWAYLQQRGVRSVLKLNRHDAEVDAAQEMAQAQRHGIRLIPVYMQPEDFPHNWNLWAHPDEATLMRAVKVLEDPANAPILVHCAHGQDRTGRVVAAYSVRNKGYCKSTAVAEMKHYGTSPFLRGLQPMVMGPLLREPPQCKTRFVPQ